MLCWRCYLGSRAFFQESSDGEIARFDAMKTNPTLLALSLLSAFSPNAFAQLSWDPTISGGPAGGTGTWDTTTGNWWDGAINTTWDNTGATEAIFPDSGGNQIVSVDSGLVVGDVTNDSTNTLQFRGTVDNQIFTIKAGGATWDTGGGQIEFNATNNLDVLLTMSAGSTLTVNGGGTFDGGERPNGANWNVGGSDLVLTESTIVRGNANTISQFDSVEFSAGGTYFHERNANQTNSADFILNGDTRFATRWARQATLSGAISGTGRVTIDSTTFNENQVDQTYIFTTANSYTGGTTVDGTSHVAVLGINGDDRLGALPVAADADNLILKGGGYLRLNGAITLNANRGVTLEDGGGFIASGAASTIAGQITGTGGLTIGRTGDGSGNVIQLNNSSNDYTGGTTVLRGTVRLGADNAFGSGGALTLGGVAGLNSFADLNGFDATVGGLQIGNGNTREVRNNGGSASTLTLDVASGESYSYQANFSGSNVVNIVKTGDGTQTFNRSGTYTTAINNVNVTGGELVWNNNNGATVAGSFTVGAGGTLSGNGFIDGAVTIQDNGTLNPGNSPGTLTFNNSLSLESLALLNMEITGTGAGEFDILANDGGDIFTAGGILALDTTGYTATSGDTFTVLENWSGFAGSFSSITGTDLGGGLSFDTGNLLIDGTLTVIPEPHTGLLSLVAGLLLVARRRRN